MADDARRRTIAAMYRRAGSASMNPALSVIFFTTLSGAGYGLLAWTALAALFAATDAPLLASIALALVLVTAGLLSSLAHLGQPQRAWRALSQWRTSWLSREGVASLLTFAPALLLALALLPGMISGDAQARVSSLALPGQLVASVLIACTLATVACTAMIYASLKPIPAWRHRLVRAGVPAVRGVLRRAAAGGVVAGGRTARPALSLLAGVAAIALVGCKWTLLARHRPQRPAGDARRCGRPARAHGRRCSSARTPKPITSPARWRSWWRASTRRACGGWRTVLFALVPIACVAAGVAVSRAVGSWFALAAVSALAGAFVERWLFFAQARHMVTLYY